MSLNEGVITLDSGVPTSHVTGVLVRGEDAETQTRREGLSGDGGEAAARQQQPPRAAGPEAPGAPRAWERQEGPSPGAFGERGARPCRHLISDP